MTFTPYKYQEETIDWLNEREENEFLGIRGGILYLKMGLGKTFISLEHIRRNGGTNLIVCSKSIISVWINEIKKFLGEEFKYFVLHSDYGSNKVKMSSEFISQFSIVITTYDYCVIGNKKTEASKYLIDGKHTLLPNKNILHKMDYHNRGILYSYLWDRIIIDESQNISNFTTKRFKAIYALPGKFRFCLTGTPIRNSAKEMWAQYKFIGLNIMDKISKYNEKDFKEFELEKVIKEIEYKDTHIVLPEKREIISRVNMTKIEKGIYASYLFKLEEAYESENIKKRIMALFKTITKMRQISNTSKLLSLKQSNVDDVIKVFFNEYFLKYKKEDQTMLYNNSGLNDFLPQTLNGIVNTFLDGGVECSYENVVIELGKSFKNEKYKKLIEHIDEIKKRGEKVIIFSAYTSYLELLETSLKEKQYNITMIKSKDSIAKRNDKLNAFENDLDILMMNYKIGAEGLNLAFANNVILLDTWWNFSLEEQAIARVYRNGQTKQVNVYRILTKFSIEEIIFKLSREKKEIMNKLKNGEEHHTIKLDLGTIKSIINIGRKYFKEEREEHVGRTLKIINGNFVDKPQTIEDGIFKEFGEEWELISEHAKINAKFFRKYKKNIILELYLKNQYVKPEYLYANIGIISHIDKHMGLKRFSTWKTLNPQLRSFFSSY